MSLQRLSSKLVKHNNTPLHDLIESMYNGRTKVISQFGAHPDNTPEANDVAIQKAFDWLVSEGDTLVGDGRTYRVNRVTIGRDTPEGGGYNRPITFEANGMTLQCESTDVKVGFYASGKMLRLCNLICVPKEPSHRVATLGFLWHSHVEGCTFKGKVIFNSGPDGYGMFWNTFLSCDFEKGVYFDVTRASINSNLILGGRCAGIELSPFPAGPTTYPVECYENKFECVDITGAIRWHSSGARSGKCPLILSDCNYEGDFQVFGDVERKGGATLPTGNNSFWDGSPANHYRSTYQFNNRYREYVPKYAGNIQRFGDAKGLPSNIKADGLTIVKHSQAVVGDSVFAWQPPQSASFPRMSIEVPQEYMGLARLVGYVTIGFFINPISGLSTIQHETTSSQGVTVGGILPPKPSGRFTYQSYTIPVKPTDTFAKLWVYGAAEGEVKNIQLSGITMHIGEASMPYSPAVENNKQRLVKAASINGSPIKLFSVDVSGKVGEISISAMHQQKSTGLSGYSKALLVFSTGPAFGPVRYSLTQIAKTSQGQGTLADMEVSISGNILTVSVANVASTDLSDVQLFIETEASTGVNIVL